MYSSSFVQPCKRYINPTCIIFNRKHAINDHNNITNFHSCLYFTMPNLKHITKIAAHFLIYLNINNFLVFAKNMYLV